MNKWKSNNEQRISILAGVISLIILIILITAIQGSRQNELYKINYQNYKQGETLMLSGQFDRAIEAFNTLIPGYADTPQVNYYMAICHAGQGKYSTAIEYMAKAQQQRIIFLRDANFLYLYGEYLYKTGEYTQAKTYLNQSLKFNTNQETITKANELLASIPVSEEKGE